MLQKELGISKISDLLEYYPYKYVDRSRIYTINELRSDMPFVQVKGRILGFEEFGSGPRKKRLVAHFTDGTGIADIVWFSGIKYATQQFKVNTEYIVFGKPTLYGGRYQFAHPDIDKAEDLQLSQMGMQPYYITTEKMKKAEFDFNDFLDQMDQMKKMGGLSNLLSMIPGIGNKMQGLDIDDGMMDKTAAIIYSMTKEERANPKIINASRKRRIAAGAGVPLAEVNRLCKQVQNQKQMMKQMSGMFGGKGGKRGGFKLPF